MKVEEIVNILDKAMECLAKKEGDAYAVLLYLKGKLLVERDKELESKKNKIESICKE